MKYAVFSVRYCTALVGGLSPELGPPELELISDPICR